MRTGGESLRITPLGNLFLSEKLRLFAGFICLERRFIPGVKAVSRRTKGVTSREESPLV